MGKALRTFMAAGAAFGSDLEALSPDVWVMRGREWLPDVKQAQLAAGGIDSRSSPGERGW